MSLKRIVGTVVFGSALSLVLYVGGCGSSSPGGGGGSGGTTGSGSGGSKGTGSGGSTGSGTGGSTGSGSGGSSGISPFPDGGGDSGGGGTCPASVKAYSPMTYTATTVTAGVCAAADITAFETACGDSFSMTACDAWFAANVAGVMDGGAGTACGNCMVPAADNGPVYIDPAGYIGPNYTACIQLTDPTNGPTCAPLYQAAVGCNDVGCDACTTDADYTKCLGIVDGTSGGCASYISAATSPCMTDLGDGGVASTMCSPGAATMKVDPNYTFIINLVCGTPG
jgi:hypothetical protein